MDHEGRMDDLEKEIKVLERKRKLLALEAELEGMEDYKTRARSVTVGTCFGGQVEISLRTASNNMFAILTPTEAIEMIHQLAAGVGCYVQLAPKQDFAAWRGWEEVTGVEVRGINTELKGAAPYALPLSHTLDDKLEKLKESKFNIIQAIIHNIQGGKEPYYGFDQTGIQAILGDVDFKQLIKMNKKELWDIMEDLPEIPNFEDDESKYEKEEDNEQ